MDNKENSAADYNSIRLQLESLKRDLESRIARDLESRVARDNESITDRSNELNDASKDRDIASSNERDQTSRSSTTDFSQDVDTQERIRANSASYDNIKAHQEMESAKRDRQQYDQDVESKNRLQRQIDAQGTESTRRDRSQLDHVVEADRRAVDQAVKLQDQLNQTYASTFAQMMSNMVTNNNQMTQNMLADSEKNKSGDRFSDYQNRGEVWRHRDHTLSDEHPVEAGGSNHCHAPKPPAA